MCIEWLIYFKENQYPQIIYRLGLVEIKSYIAYRVHPSFNKIGREILVASIYP